MRRCSLLWMSAGVSVAVLALAGGCASNRTPERNFATLDEARQGGGLEPGWMPEALIPASGRNLRARRDLGSNEFWARFEFDAADRPALTVSCQRVGQNDFRLPGNTTRGIGWWPEMLRNDPAAAAQQFEVHACTAGAERGFLAVHRSLSTAFYWRPVASR